VPWFASTVTIRLAATAPTAADLLFEVASLPAPDLSNPAVAEFAEQFALDVSAIDGDQRAAYFAATGDQAFAVVQRVYAADFVPRVRSVLGAVLGAEDWPELDPYTADSWALLESFMVAVARLRELEATTTELVRLRGARLHDCAVCKSRRSADAIEAGANGAAFDAVDNWLESDLPASIKAALALTDALIWTPYDVAESTVEAARTHLSEAQVIEVVLDVMRNAANKIAVALGADAATVTDGVELFTTDPDGVLTVVGVA
jgi:alkylhydroperoxidase family enzyme